MTEVLTNIQGDIILSPKYKEKIRKRLFRGQTTTSKELLDIFMSGKRYLGKYLPMKETIDSLSALLMDHYYKGEIRSYFSQLDPRIDLVRVQYFINDKKGDFDLSTRKQIKYLAISSSIDEILAEIISRFTMEPMTGGGIIYNKENFINILNDIQNLMDKYLKKNKLEYIPVLGTEYNKTIFSKIIQKIRKIIFYIKEIEDTNIYILEQSRYNIRFPIEEEML